MGALFTGHTPSLEARGGGVVGWNGRTWCGLSRFAVGGEEGCIPDGVPTLGELMRDAGYETIGVVTNRLLFSPAGLERGFDQWHELEVGSPVNGVSRPPADAARVNEVFAGALDRRRSDRFFLYLHYMDVHDYYMDLGEELGDAAAYDRRVERVDRAIGEVVATLEEQGLLRDSFLVVTSDHGHRLAGEAPHLVPGGREHTGSPSFEEVLNVPLIVMPALAAAPRRGLRTEDTFDLLLARAGISPPADSVLEADELFLSEARWQTYRSGAFKSYRRRGRQELLLVDLRSDPGETADVALANPDVVRAHRERTRELSRRLSGPRISERTPEDTRRLRALGYVE